MFPPSKIIRAPPSCFVSIMRSHAQRVNITAKKLNIVRKMTPSDILKKLMLPRSGFKVYWLINKIQTFIE